MSDELTRRAAREWFEHAERDRLAAETLLEATTSTPEQVAFLCQQAAEKYLKAWLGYLGEDIPRTHDLLAIVDRLDGLGSTEFDPDVLRPSARELEPYAVQARYPLTSTSPTNEDASEALAAALEIRRHIRPRIAPAFSDDTGN